MLYYIFGITNYSEWNIYFFLALIAYLSSLMSKIVILCKKFSLDRLNCFWNSKGKILFNCDFSLEIDKFYIISSFLHPFLLHIATMQCPRRGPALSIQIVNFLIEFVGALYCFLHFTEFSQNYPWQFQCKPFLKCQQTQYKFLQH